MFIIVDPGPWQYYHYRPDNIGLNAGQLKQKYLQEQMLFEQQQFEAYTNWLQGQGKGIPDLNSNSQIELATQNGLVLQTQNGLNLIIN
jgi:hypothetical protein